MSVYEGHGVTLHHADCLDVLRSLPDCSVDSVVCDPPYGLEFMGKEWDSFRPDVIVNRGGGVPGRAAWDSTKMAPVEYGGAKQRSTLVCDGCGKSDKFRNAHDCPDGTGWTRRNLDTSVARVAYAKAFQDWCEAWATECLRVLKPGGHLLAFGGTRTWHRLACAVEDAGFEVRDSIAWLHGQGFPKSLDVSKAIDKAAGAEREVVGPSPFAARKPNGSAGVASVGLSSTPGLDLTAPATDAARTWQGWGTALKPAFEPVVVARKPLAGTVAATVLAHGTGALNIDGCRIGTGGEKIHVVQSDPRKRQSSSVRVSPQDDVAAFRAAQAASIERTNTLGRWPANVVLDESQAEALDEQSGESAPKPARTGRKGGCSDNGTMTGYGTGDDVGTWPADAGGGASRFFYVAKAPKGERPVAFRPSCNCETMKPWTGQSQPRDTAGSESAGDRSWNTSTSGSSTTDATSPRGTTSTTETATSSTTTSGTSNSSRSSSTSESTPVANSETASGGSPAPSAANSSPSTSSTGTSARKAGPSTADAGHATSGEWSETSACGRCGAPAKREAHPTVKPLSLMRWLVRLVTPPGGTVLEPFAGSGTTVEACIVEGFDCIAIEKGDEYLPLIMQRIHRRRDPVEAVRQRGEDLGLFDHLEGAP